MNVQRATKLIPLLQAMVEGKTIQHNAGGTSYWIDLAFPAFDVPLDLYRIKPEPIEIWCMVSRGNNVLGNGYKTKEIAAKNLAELAADNKGIFDGYEIKLFRQVLDDKSI